MLEMANLREERDRARSEVARLEGMVMLSPQGLDNRPHECFMMTGLSLLKFRTTAEFLAPYTGQQCSRLKVPFDQMFLLTLVKLKQNCTFSFMAHLSKICVGTLSRIFWHVIHLVFYKLSFLVRFQERSNVFDTIPSVMKVLYPRLTCIIDCFEIFIESPKRLQAKQQCYSQYKKHSTVKVFISSTPNGAVNYVSKCWGVLLMFISLGRAISLRTCSTREEIRF